MVQAQAEAGAAAVYHCVSRVVDKRYTFDDVEREPFVHRMCSSADSCGGPVLTGCVMSHRFHPLVEVAKRPETPLEDDRLRAGG